MSFTSIPQTSQDPVPDQLSPTTKNGNRTAVRDALSRPLRDLRISLIDRCNLRCVYCMPREVFGPDYAFLPKSEWLDFTEIERLARAFVTLGVRKLRLTGGEPLLRPNLPELAARLSKIDDVEDLAITTNGLLLAPMAAELKKAGVDRVTISLDALDPELLGHMNGLGVPPTRVLKGIDAAIACGLSPKINMVVQKGMNECEILPMARYFHDRRVPLRFIEYMDVGNGQRWDRSQVVPSDDILQLLRSEFSLDALPANAPGEVARRFGNPTGDWEVGFVSSISSPFCSSCNRARISADGKLYTCLFATAGTDLKPILESNPDTYDLEDSLAKLWVGRKDRYSELRSGRAESNDAASRVPMSFVGG